jgi:hypothetical protein
VQFAIAATVPKSTADMGTMVRISNAGEAFPEPIGPLLERHAGNGAISVNAPVYSGADRLRPNLAVARLR